MAEGLNPDAIQAFTARAGEGPVAMLNLIKLRPDGGVQSYAAYMEAVRPLAAGVGARVVYMGRGAELLIGRADEDWDLVLIIEYPSRRALLEMTATPEYQAVVHLRNDSLSRSVLLATDPMA